ncbi:hypothetical protein BKA70DRAFT_1427292 [Coprinopsis sp. MPI-PUGE-AT-0042]|nr:hypothetical protein BKA70DRAFT_1427292 [Coprinopsis sp. MPI-PUGE-AT-0042]
MADRLAVVEKLVIEGGAKANLVDPKASMPSRSTERTRRRCQERDRLCCQSRRRLEGFQLRRRLWGALNRVRTSFQYPEDKDIFQTFSKTKLSRRLVHGVFASNEAEVSMVPELNEPHGFEYTDKLQCIFTGTALRPKQRILEQAGKPRNSLCTRIALGESGLMSCVIVSDDSDGANG